MLVSFSRLLLVALYVFIPSITPVCAQPPETAQCFTPINWVVVVDTSQSMDGKGPGAKKIFPLVRDVLHKFVPEIHDEDKLTLFAFDTTSNRLISITGLDRGEAITEIDRMHPMGLSTNLGAAIRDSLAEVYSSKDENRPSVIILLSDGHEDIRLVPPGVRFPMPAVSALVRDSRVPFFFYASLGQDPDPELMNLIELFNRKASGHAAFFDDPGASGLAAEIAKVRQTVCPPAHLTIKLKEREMKGSSGDIDLGSINRGATSAPYPIDILSDVATPLRIETHGVHSGHQVRASPAGLMDVGPQQYKRVELTAGVPEDAADGLYDFQLTLQPTGSAAVSIRAYYSVVPTLAERFRRALAWGSSNWIELVSGVVLLLLLLFILWRGSRPKERPVATLEAGGESIPLTGDIEYPKVSPAIRISRDGDSHRIYSLRGTLKVNRPSVPKAVPVKPGEDFRLSSGDIIETPAGIFRYHNQGRIR